MANCPDRMLRFVSTTPNIVRPMTAKIIMDKYGAFVHFVRSKKNAGRIWSRDNRSIDPLDEIIPVRTPIVNHEGYQAYQRTARELHPRRANTVTTLTELHVPREAIICCLNGQGYRNMERRPR
jgi:hypothetical protein